MDAFLTITEDAALAQAAALDEKGIDADNVMAGIPLAVKDNISTKGILTTAASKMLYNYEPIFDATSVSQAYAKDMIIVGKTNMDEFAMGGSNENSAFKPTKMLGTRQSSWWFFRWFSGTVLLVRSVCHSVLTQVVPFVNQQPLMVSSV